MESPFPGKLRYWDGWSQATVRQRTASIQFQAAFEEMSGLDRAERLFAAEALYPLASRRHRQMAPEPFSLQWFEEIESVRHGRQGAWIPKLLEFGKHAGETLLGLGNSLGTDWVQYARHGATVVVCSPSVEHLTLARRNFELRGLSARFLHSQVAALPLETSSIDVVCLCNLLHELQDAGPVIDEVYRVLKPGGKVLSLAPARHDVSFWYQCCFPWLKLFPSRMAEGAEDSIRYSRRDLRRLFGRYVEHRIHKRHLRRSEVPHLWRWAPRPVLERIMGRILVLKAFKPLSAAIAAQLAA